MLEVSIASEREYDKNYESLNYDLMSKKDIKKAFEQVDTIFENGSNYIIVNIESENNWANYDEYTLLDDITEIALLIHKMNELQYNSFIAIAQEQIHEPIDIAKNVLNNTITLDSENADEDDIWETAIIENKKYIILY